MKNGYQHMVIDYYVHKLREMRAKRTAELSSLRGREDALAYQAKVRAAVAKAYAPFPERCPLDAVTTGVLECDGFKIEKVRFCSRPGYWVTGNLYIPNGLTAPAPASLGACGHSLEGKFSNVYQKFALRLVKNGFVVLMYDPVQQGERNQYLGLDYLGQAEGLCAAHNVMGKQLELLGESMPSWRVWDGIRAMDYILTRPEVDKSRIGITGNSGGGTLTEWIWANEDRLAFAAPSCHVTSFMTNLENELPTDAEQCPIGVLGAGLEMVDMMICQAPKPAILLGQKYDFFERRGLQEAYRELKHFYSLLGAAENAELFIGPTTHGYSDHNQREMVRFFRKAAGLSGEPFEYDPQPHTVEELRVYPEGGVLKAGSRPIYKLMQEKADQLEASRKAPVGGEWQKVLTDMLKIPAIPAEPPHFRCLRPQRYEGQVWSRNAIETEGDIRALMRKRLVDTGHAGTLDVEEKVVLYLPNCSSEADSIECDCLKNLKPGGPVYALDVRGLGESLPEEGSGIYHQPYGMDYMMHAFAMMFGESYMGLRVYDILRTMDLLAAEGARSIELAGRGQGAILVAFAAMLRPQVARVTLFDAPASFREWLDAKVCDWPAASMPLGVLKYFDLPDLYAALGDRLTIQSYWNAYMQTPSK